MNHPSTPFASAAKKQQLKKKAVHLLWILTAAATSVYVLWPKQCEPLSANELLLLGKKTNQNCLFIEQNCILLFSVNSAGVFPATPVGRNKGALFRPKIVSKSGEQTYLAQKNGGLPLEHTGPRKLILEGSGASLIDKHKQYKDIFVLEETTSACIWDAIGEREG